MVTYAHMNIQTISVTPPPAEAKLHDDMVAEQQQLVDDMEKMPDGSKKKALAQQDYDNLEIDQLALEQSWSLPPSQQDQEMIVRRSYEDLAKSYRDFPSRSLIGKKLI